MATMNILPILKIKELPCSLDSKFTDVANRCNYLTLPLQVSDIISVLTFNALHAQCSVGKFLKFQGKPYCSKQHKLCNFYLVVRRGNWDYKITAKDFRLELLRLKGVLK